MCRAGGHSGGAFSNRGGGTNAEGGISSLRARAAKPRRPDTGHAPPEKILKNWRVLVHFTYISNKYTMFHSSKYQHNVTYTVWEMNVGLYKLRYSANNLHR